MRVRRLLFLLVPIVLGGTTPLHAALGPAPLCLAPVDLQATPETVDVKPPIPQPGDGVSNYEPDDEERDYLIKTIAFEAPDEFDEGKAAVAHVILNRTRNGRWGDNIKDVVTRPWQFEPWMTRRKEMEKLSPHDPRYQNAARIADAVLTGQMPDPTAGATHFLNPTVVRQRRDGSLPSWARGEGQPIGRHTFYSPNEGVTGSGRAAPSMGAWGDPLRIDTSSQPLTRADCGNAGMLWDEGANVCSGGDVINALGESESKSTKGGESLAVVHKPEITTVESPAKVETTAPRIRAKPKTAKSPIPNRPKVATARASSKSKHVKSSGSRGRAVAARSSTKSSVASKNSGKGASKSSVKTVSRSSVKSASKGSVRSASKSSVKGASKGSVRSASKSSVKGASKGSVRSALKSSVKGASKSSVRSASKSSGKGAFKSPVKAAAKEP